jgi:hypothetical protein
LQESVGFDHLQDLAALDALDQNFNIAVGQFEALHDVDDGADLKNVIGLRFVDRGIVLCGEKYLFVAGESFFERPNARFPAHHERGHHVGEDDHVTNGHHG